MSAVASPAGADPDHVRPSGETQTKEGAALWAQDPTTTRLAPSVTTWRFSTAPPFGSQADPTFGIGRMTLAHVAGDVNEVACGVAVGPAVIAGAGVVARVGVWVGVATDAGGPLAAQPAGRPTRYGA